MANYAGPLQPAIDELEKDLSDIERKGNALFTALNVLRAKAGMPPRHPWGGGGGEAPSSSGSDGGTSGAVLSQIHPDTFLGKRMGTASRLFLEMRKAQGGPGPAKPREILDALKLGGFQFDTKDDGVALISVRNMLRKNTQVFFKLQNGTYGLRTWYPGAKPAKPAAGATEDEILTPLVEGDEEGESETADAAKTSAA